MPSRANLETQQQRDFSYVQREPWPGSTCCIFQQVSETPNGSFWVQDHLITLIPRLPSDPAARVGGREARFQHVTGAARADGVSSPRLSQCHQLPSARPGRSAALGLALPPSPWQLLAHLPFLEGVLLILFPQSRICSLDSGELNRTMPKKKVAAISPFMQDAWPSLWTSAGMLTFRRTTQGISCVLVWQVP